MEEYNPEKHGALVDDKGMTPYDPKAHGELALESATEGPKEAPKFHPETDSVFTHFNLIEGTESHVGLDKENLTLARGIVPDSVMFDGKEIMAGKNNLTDKYLSKNRDKLDWSTATKTVFGKTFVGADYESEDVWGKAILNEYVGQVKKVYPDLQDKGAVSSLVSFMWNTSSDTSTLGWSGTRNTVAELRKAPADRDTQKLFDIAKHSFAGGQPSIGLLKRRVGDLNGALKKEQQGRYVTMAPSESGGTLSYIFDNGGQLLYRNESKKPFPYSGARSFDVQADREINPMLEENKVNPENVTGKKLEPGLYEDSDSGDQWIVHPDGRIQRFGVDGA